jgi:hypothetical protein
MAFDPDIPESFYALVGHIATEAALLEEWLVELAVSLDMSKNIAKIRELADPSPRTHEDWLADLDAGWSEHGGQPGTRLVTHLRKGFAPHVPPLDRTDFENYLSAVKKALNTRHEVVHSVWVNLMTDPPQYVGTRRLPPGKKRASNGGKVGVTVTMTEAEMADLSEDLNPARPASQRVEGPDQAQEVSTRGALAGGHEYEEARGHGGEDRGRRQREGGHRRKADALPGARVT